MARRTIVSAVELMAALVLVIAPADTVIGIVADSATTAPIQAAEVRLLPDTTASRPGSGTHVALTDADGRFRLAGLSPGRYLLLVRRLGYAMRRGVVVVGAAPHARLDVRLAPRQEVLGVWAPDSATVERNRRRRAEWRCAVPSTTDIESARSAWALKLYTGMGPETDSLQTAWRLPRDVDGLLRGQVLVTDRRTCQRAGAAYDDAVGAELPEFLVFEIGSILLVQEAGRLDASVLLDRRFRHLETFFVP
jgi:hypothetical protein